MQASVKTAAILGIEATPVTVEAEIVRGLNKVFVVGLPEITVKECLARVRAAIKNSGFTWPRGLINIVLTPHELRKSGTAFDLPVALAVLHVSGQLPASTATELASTIYAGELSLDGGLLPIPGGVCYGELAHGGLTGGALNCVLPLTTAREGAVTCPADTYGAECLADVVTGQTPRIDPPAQDPAHPCYPVDFAEVKGQPTAKRAMEIAAAGGHNLLLWGPPGTGKTMLARRMITILPALSFQEALETSKVYSVVSGLPPNWPLLTERPFCAPHYTVSEIGLTGGGTGVPRPGLASLAHNGVLFLDDLPEFPRHVLEALRSPLEDKHVCLTRGNVTVTYPANVQLVAAMNPCLCGYHNAQAPRPCDCTADSVARYRARIQPLRSTFDLIAPVRPVSYSELMALGHTNGEESSAVVRARVTAARAILASAPGPRSVPRTIAALAGRTSPSMEDRAEAECYGWPWP